MRAGQVGSKICKNVQEAPRPYTEKLAAQLNTAYTWEVADLEAVVDCRQHREGLKQLERPHGVLR